MPYASTTEIEVAAGGAARYVQVFDWDSDGAADAAVIAQLQLEVDAWIDSYAAKRFAVPIANPSKVLTLQAAEEVVYKARLKRGMATQDDQVGHENRVKWLEALAKGHVVPSDPQPAAASSVRSGWVSRDDDDVSREGLKGAW